MTEPAAAVTLVHHVAVEIAAPADAVWRVILDEYVEATKFRETGYAIEPIDDACAVLGGYRMRFERDGAVVDDRICQITERDDAARRLSMFADYLSVPGGMQVFATYHAQDVAGGCRYALDCHSRLGAEALAAGGGDIAAAVAGAAAQARAALIGYLENIKARIEGGG